MTKRTKTISWVLQILVAVILGQALFFKFSGAPESRHVFETLGVEPWGRFATGIAELFVVILLLIPRRAALGALASIGVMVGAVGSHLASLGIVVMDDSGGMFIMALVVLLASVGIAWIRRAELPIVGNCCAPAVVAREDPAQS